MQADALEPEQWRDQLQGAVGVVSCLGGFGSNAFMLKVLHSFNFAASSIIRQITFPQENLMFSTTLLHFNFPCHLPSHVANGMQQIQCSARCICMSRFLVTSILMLQKA